MFYFRWEPMETGARKLTMCSSSQKANHSATKRQRRKEEATVGEPSPLQSTPLSLTATEKVHNLPFQLYCTGQIRNTSCLLKPPSCKQSLQQQQQHTNRRWSITLNWPFDSTLLQSVMEFTFSRAVAAGKCAPNCDITYSHQVAAATG